MTTQERHLIKSWTKWIWIKKMHVQEKGGKAQWPSQKKPFKLSDSNNFCLQWSWLHRKVVLTKLNLYARLNNKLLIVKNNLSTPTRPENLNSRYAKFALSHAETYHRNILMKLAQLWTKVPQRNENSYLKLLIGQFFVWGEAFVTFLLVYIVKRA